MSTKLEFKGKDVDEAINNACRRMHVAREELDIEIVATGSSGIFGLCKKQAVVLVSKKEQDAPTGLLADEGKKQPATPSRKERKPTKSYKKSAKSPAKPTPAPVSPSSHGDVQPAATDIPAEEIATAEKNAGNARQPRKQAEPPLAPEVVTTIKDDLAQLLSLMQFPSEIATEVDGHAVMLDISGDQVDDIIANDGQILDSLQYLMRKIIGKKFPQKIMLELNAGNFREQRKIHLQELAVKLAAEVKQTEKTRTISPLNPSERRIVHVALQDDKTIRSRSVGEGLFKKIIIYLPGKARTRKQPTRRKGRKN